MNTTAPPAPPTEPPATPSTPAPQTFDPLLILGAPGSSNPTPTSTPNPNQMTQMQIAYQQQMMMMQQQMQQMQMAYGSGNNYARQGSGAVPPMPMGNPRPNVMGANYMRQVPGVQGDKMTSFSFLGGPQKQESNSFDFVKDAMKKG
jgi:hypothetical protein